MLETLLGISSSSIMGIIGLLAVVVSVFTEFFKKILPKKFPTKALNLIISFITTIVFVIAFCPFNIQMIIMGIAGSFVVSFISMYGWDTFNELIDRFKKP